MWMTAQSSTLPAPAPTGTMSIYRRRHRHIDTLKSQSFLAFDRKTFGTFESLAFAGNFELGELRATSEASQRFVR